MNNPPFDVVVVGSVGIDTNVYPYSGDIDFSVEANFTENIDYIGQAGGYASRGYNRLGKRTAFIGHVGNDHSGKYIAETLSKDGIDISGMFIDPMGTARSVNFMYGDGRRKNFYDGKGHMDILPDVDKCRELFRGAKLAHFNILNWTRHLLPVARSEGVVVAVDIQDVVDVNDPYRQDYIAQSDILFFSAVNFPDPTPVINTFRERNPGVTMIMGMGAKGCALSTVEGTRFFDPVEMDRPIVDTNGAGDGLAVGFLTSHILEGYSLEESITRGQINARYSCTLRANTDDLLTMEGLDGYYREMMK